MDNGVFRVKYADFEGPLDLLLSLIEKRKFFINDIALAQVADDYMAHIKNMEQFPVKDTAHFLLVASTLVLIKSKSLLPTLNLTEEEQEDMEDLQMRLRIYQTMRDAGERNIKDKFGSKMLFFKQLARQIEPVFSPDKDSDTSSFLVAIKQVINSLPQKEKIQETTVKKIMSLEEMMDTLAERMQNNLKLSFREFSNMGKEEKVHIVVSFLAMLELVKQGIIDVIQTGRFEDIDIESRNVGIPRYNNI